MTDVYIPKRLDTGPERSHGRLVKIGTWIASLAIGNVLGVGATDAVLYAHDSLPGPNPRQDQIVDATASTLLGGVFNVICDDISTAKATNGAGHLKGYVDANLYAMPLSTIRLSSQREHLDVSVCEPIEAIALDTSSTTNDSLPSLTYEQIIALTIAAHERTHTRGDLDEAHTECVALQETAGALEANGYDIAHNKSMTKAVISHATALPATYQDTRCRVGGEWDLSDADSRMSNAWLPERA